jgi:hypothetical protein
MCLSAGIAVMLLVVFVVGLVGVLIFESDKSHISYGDRDMAKCTRREFIAKSGINLSKKDDI